MKFSKTLPSDEKVLTDQKTGVKFSYRDVTMISSMVNQSSSLIKFGEEKYNQYKGTDNLLLIYEVAGKGKGYLSYKIKDEVEVNDIFSDCINNKEEKICYEALIETVFNTCKSISKNLVVNSENESFKCFVDDMNQKYKEQKIEDKYWWKIE